MSVENAQIGEKISLKVQEFLETGKIQEASTFYSIPLYTLSQVIHD